MTIVEFLTARLNEEAELAQRVSNRYHRGIEPRERYWPLPSITAGANRYSDPDIRAGFDLIRLYGPDRVLAEIAAKRRIVELWEYRWQEANDATEEHMNSMYASQATGLGNAVRAIAEIYAEHPDFDPDWLV